MSNSQLIDYPTNVMWFSPKRGVSILLIMHDHAVSTWPMIILPEEVGGYKEWWV